MTDISDEIQEIITEYDDLWTGNYVYYGKYNNKPLEKRLLLLSTVDLLWMIRALSIP